MKHRLRILWGKYQQEIVFGIFAVLFIAGVVQYALGLQYVLPLTPLMLALLAVAALYFWDAHAKQKLLLTIAVLALGFVVELIGTRTGLLFGDYAYGSLLGTKLFDVPMMIGVTWLLVTLAAWQIVLYGTLNVYERFALAGVLVVMLDIVLEQFAIAYGLWTWQGNTVPLYNYVCWFFISLICFWLFHRFTPHSKPSFFIAALMPLMAVFFWIMLVLA